MYCPSVYKKKRYDTHEKDLKEYKGNDCKLSNNTYPTCDLEWIYFVIVFIYLYTCCMCVCVRVYIERKCSSLMCIFLTVFYSLIVTMRWVRQLIIITWAKALRRCFQRPRLRLSDRNRCSHCWLWLASDVWKMNDSLLTIWWISKNWGNSASQLMVHCESISGSCNKFIHYFINQI